MARRWCSRRGPVVAVIEDAVWVGARAVSDTASEVVSDAATVDAAAVGVDATAEGAADLKDPHGPG